MTASRAREAAKKAREASRKNSSSNSSLLGKLARCTDEGADYAELFIVEGDSAGGSAKARQKQTAYEQSFLFGVKCLMLKNQELTRFTTNEKLVAYYTWHSVQVSAMISISII